MSNQIYKELREMDQMIQNRIIDIDEEIETMEKKLNDLKNELEKLGDMREKECEKFKKVDEIRKLLKEV